MCDKTRARLLIGRHAQTPMLMVLTAVSITGLAQTVNEGGDTRDDSRVVLEELVVTAQRREERLQDVPLSVTAYSAQAIEAAGYRETREILTSTPNVDFTTEAHGLASSAGISIRGVGTVVSDIDQPVAVYLDDVFLANTGAINLNAVDLERVEVLRGPQGTLYGRNAMVGAVNYVSREPQRAPEASLELSYGNYDYMQAKAMGNVPVLEDKLLLRANATYSKRDGTVKNLFTGADINELDNIGGRLQVTSKLTDALTLKLAGDYSRDRIVTGALSPLSITRNHQNSLPYPYDEDRKVYGGAARLVYDAERFQFLSISGVRAVEDYYVGSSFAPSDIGIQGGRPFANQRQFSQEFRLVSAGEGPLEWVAGAYYFDEDKTLSSFFEMHEFATIFSFLFGDPTGTFVPQGYTEEGRALLRTEAVAGFGDLTYSVTDRFAVTVGARYGREDKSMDYAHHAQPDLGFPIFAPQQSFAVEDTFDSFLPKLTLNFRPTDDALLYTTISRGFKSGGFNNQFLGPAFDASGTPIAAPTEEQLRANFGYQPEKLWNYEIGFKSSWSNERLLLNGAAFYMDWTDQQLVTWNTQYTRIANAKEARSYGAEIELIAQPTVAFLLSAGVGYSNPTLRSDTVVPDPLTQAPVNIKGKRQPNTSKLTGNLGAQYTPNLSTERRLLLRADVTYRSSQFFDVFNSPQTRENGYTLLNLRAGIEADRWGVYLFGSNVTDEKYLTTGIAGFGRFLNQLNDAGLYAYRSDEFLAVAGDPPTYGLTWRVKY